MGKSQDAEKMGWRPEEKGAGEERVYSGDTLKRLLMNFRDLGVDRKPWGLARVCRVPPSSHVLDLTAFPPSYSPPHAPDPEPLMGLAMFCLCLLHPSSQHRDSY